jgi:hypothetical protein
VERWRVELFGEHGTLNDKLTGATDRADGHLDVLIVGPGRASALSSRTASNSTQ